MSDAIVCCACGSVPDYCKKSFKILFSKESLPQLYIKDRAKELLETVPAESELHLQVSRILRRKGRYGFYFEYDETGHILDYWNLLKSRRVV